MEKKISLTINMTGVTLLHCIPGATSNTLHQYVDRRHSYRHRGLELSVRARQMERRLLPDPPPTRVRRAVILRGTLRYGGSEFDVLWGAETGGHARVGRSHAARI